MSKNPQKLSIAFLFDDTLDSTDGVAQNVKVLGKWLSAEGHKVTYLVGETKLKSWSGGKVFSLSKNLRVRWNGNRLSMPLPAPIKGIKSALESSSFDVVHVQVPYSPFMAKRVINRLTDDVAVGGTFHILPANWLSSWGLKLLRLTLYGRSLRRFDFMAATSQPAAAFCQASLRLPTTIIPNPVESKRFVGALGKQSGHQIVFLGRLVKRKGCRQLILAFAELAKTNQQAKLTIAGKGPERKKLESLVNKLVIKDRVEFLGFVSEEAKPSLLASADIACFPSLYGESFGIVLIEAMAAGAGVVLGGNNPGYASVLEPQPKLLVNPRDTQQFAQRLNLLLSDKKLTAKLHTWQKSYVKQFDVEVVGKQVLSAYQQAIAKRKQKLHN